MFPPSDYFCNNWQNSISKKEFAYKNMYEMVYMKYKRLKAEGIEIGKYIINKRDTNDDMICILKSSEEKREFLISDFEKIIDNLF